jgi:hypothetical protein
MQTATNRINGLPAAPGRHEARISQQGISAIIKDLSPSQVGTLKRMVDGWRALAVEQISECQDARFFLTNCSRGMVEAIRPGSVRKLLRYKLVKEKSDCSWPTQFYMSTQLGYTVWAEIELRDKRNTNETTSSVIAATPHYPIG